MTSYCRRFASWLARVSPLLAIAAPLEAQVSESAAIFAQHVAPMFAAKCAGCHGAKQRLSGLSLATREDLLKGGNRSPALQSLLVQGTITSAAASWPRRMILARWANGPRIGGYLLSPLTKILSSNSINAWSMREIQA